VDYIVILFSVVVELMPQNTARYPSAQVHLVEKLFVFDTAKIFAVRPHAVNSPPNFRAEYSSMRYFRVGFFLVVAIITLKRAVESNNIENFLDAFRTRGRAWVTKRDGSSHDISEESCAQHPRTFPDCPLRQINPHMITLDCCGLVQSFRPRSWPESQNTRAYFRLFAYEQFLQNQNAETITSFNHSRIMRIVTCAKEIAAHFADVHHVRVMSGFGRASPMPGYD